MPGFPVHHQLSEPTQTCPLSPWCLSNISFSVIPFSSCHQSLFPRIRVFSHESILCIRWPKYWNFSFSISPSNEYSGLISFRMDWLDLLAVKSINSSVCLLWRNVYLVLWPTFWLGRLFFWNWAARFSCVFLRLILCCFICHYFLLF